jgi:glycosyltransferase involved in cell wall biosynthesis
MSQKLPFVSLLTPTFNRRRFIPQLIQYIKHQTYPRELMEWLILDDGTDPIEDLIRPHEKVLNIRYFRHEEKLNVSEKRNRLNKEAKGDVLVCMDDDDYYPPLRVEHCVRSLMQNRQFQVCGCSTVHLYFTDDKSIWKIGPYAPYHATFGTMAYTKKYAETHQCDETVIHAEEINFLNRYSEPLYQLNPTKCMLVLCHNENTFDKKDLRRSGSTKVVKTALKIRDFVENKVHREFYASLTTENTSPK